MRKIPHARWKSIHTLLLITTLVPTLLLPAGRASAQGYSMSTFGLIYDESGTNCLFDPIVPDDTPIASSDTFCLLFTLYGEYAFADGSPGGTLTLDLDGATFTGWTPAPPPLPNFECTGNDPVVCSWDDVPPDSGNLGSGPGFNSLITFESPFVTSQTDFTVTGTISPLGNPPRGVNMDAITMTTLPGEDLETILEAPSELEVDELFTFDITVRNNGASPSVPQETQAGLPQAWTLIDGSVDGCHAPTATLLRCPIGVLPPGGEATVTYTAQAPEGPVLDPGDQLTARWFNFAQQDDVAENDIDRQRIIVNEASEQAELVLTVFTSGDGEVAAGAPFTYGLTVENVGNAPAISVMLTHALPEVLEILSTMSDGTCSVTDGLLQCDLGNLLPGAQATVTLQATTDVVGDVEIHFQTEEGSETVTISVIDAPLFELCGVKFIDFNGNGLRDTPDAGYGGVTFELLVDGEVVATTVSGRSESDTAALFDEFDAPGVFCFENLTAGVYEIREIVPDGMRQTFPEGTVEVELATGSQPPIRFGNSPFEEGPDDDGDGFTDDPTEIPVPGVAEFDFGDLPEPRTGVSCPSLTCYPTRSVLGPSHRILTVDKLSLGAQVDADMDGQPEPTSLGDDVLDGSDDEDGLVGYSILGDGSIRFDFITTVESGLAFIDAWVDLNDDGAFETVAAGIPPPPEYVLVGEAVGNGAVSLTTRPGLVDPSEELGYARFRITSWGTNLPIFRAEDGEVEDYVLIGADFGDAQSVFDEDHPEYPGGYPTTLAQDGARHIARGNVRLGMYIDAEDVVYGDRNAAEDDGNRQLNDEDGFEFLDGFRVESVPDSEPVLAVSRASQVRLLPLPSTEGKLDGWIDYNRDGDWDDEGEQVFASVDISPQMDEDDALVIDLPANASAGFTFSRFRFSLLGGLEPAGAAPSGEVEDYLLRVDVGQTDLQIVNLLEGAGPGKRAVAVDVYIDDARVADDVAPGSATLFETAFLVGAIVTVDVVDGAASDNSAPLYSEDVDLSLEQSGPAQTNALVIIGTGDSPQILVQRDARTESADPLSADVSFAHAVDGFDTLDLFASSVTTGPLASAVEFGASTEYFAFEPTPVVVEARSVGSGVQEGAVRLELAGAEGTARMVILTGTPGNVGAIAFDGQGTRSDPIIVTGTESDPAVPDRLHLHGNYPNPFAAQTTIRLDLPESANVGVEVFDIVGRSVLTIPSAPLDAGAERGVAVDGTSLSPGVYVYRVTVDLAGGRQHLTGRFIMMK